MVLKKLCKKRLFTAVLAMFILLAAMLSSCGKKTFDDPAEHFRYVESEAISDGLDAVSVAYGATQTVEGLRKNVGGTSAIDIDISDEALNILELLAGGELDLSWLSNIGIDSSAYFDGELYSFAIDLLLGDSKLTDIDLAMDYSTSTMYLSLPDILTKTISIDYKDLTSVDIAALMEEASSLPNGKTVTALVEKYTDMILDGVKTVERIDGNITASGVEEACTILKVTVTEEDAKNIATTVLTALKTDEELKNVIVAYVDYLIKVGMNDVESGTDFYETFVADIDGILAEFEENTADEESDPIILIDCVNSDNEIIGRTFMEGDNEIIGYSIAKNGKDFGFEIKIEGEALFVGNGTMDKNVNGEFKITESGTDYAIIKLTDVAGDLTKGTVDIEIIELPDAEGTEMLASIFAVYSLRVSFDKEQTEIAVMNGDDKFVTVTVKTELKDVEKPALPAEGDTYELTADLDTSELSALLDLAPLFENMNDSPIPGEYVNLLQIALAMALQGQ